MSEPYVVAKVSLVSSDDPLKATEIIGESPLRISFYINETLNTSIDRSFGRFMEFYASIRKIHNLPDTLKLEAPGSNGGLITSKVERYLNSLFDILGDNFWKDSEVVDFIDDGVEISILTEERLNALSSKAAELEKDVNDRKEAIQRAESNISRLQVARARDKDERHAKVRAFLLSEDDDPTPPLPPVTSSSTARSSDASDEFDENAPMPLFMIRRNLPHQNSNNSQISCETDRESVSVFGSSLTDVYSYDTSLPSSSFLPGDLIGTILKNHIYEDSIDDILKLISSPHHLIHMNDVNFLSNHLKASIPNLRIFDIGLHSIGFSLVDDEIKMLLISDQQPTATSDPLDKQVVNVLRSISHPHNQSGSGVHKKGLNPDMNDGTDYTVSFNPQHQKPGLLVGCLNGNTSFTIVFQDETEACLLLMFEEFNQLIGKDDLFKKSVMLIRSWWIHESIIYVGATIKHYLPNSAFIVMVLAIFNKYHHHIHTPFQALCLFLGDFALYNPATQWITIDGFVEHAATNSSSTQTTPSHVSSHPIQSQSCCSANLLIDPQFVNKYKELAHVQYCVHNNVQSGSNSQNNSNNNSSDNIYVLPLPSELPNGNAVTIPTSGKHSHPSSGVYIVNPLNGSNMATEKLTANQVIRLTKALQNGAANLAVFIRQLEEGQNNTPKQAQLIKNFFPNIVSAASNSVSKHEIRVKMGRSSDEMRKELLSCINYNNFVTKGILMSDALIAVTVLILQEQGGLRTSDIIAEMMMKVSPAAREALMEADVDILNMLTTALHEKSNELFVIVEDNPVDPHIILQETLSPQQLAMVARGTASVQSLIQFSKTNLPSGNGRTMDTSAINGHHGMFNNNNPSNGNVGGQNHSGGYHQNHHQTHHNQMRGGNAGMSSGVYHAHSNFGTNNNNRGGKVNMNNMGMGNKNASAGLNYNNFQQPQQAFANNRGNSTNNNAGGNNSSTVPNFPQGYQSSNTNMNNSRRRGSGHFAPQQGISRQSGQVFRGGFSLGNNGNDDLSPSNSFMSFGGSSQSSGSSSSSNFGGGGNRFHNNPRLAALGLTGGSNNSNTSNSGSSLGSGSSRLFGDDLLRSMSGNNLTESTSSNSQFSGLLGNNKSISDNWLDGFK